MRFEISQEMVEGLDPEKAAIFMGFIYNLPKNIKISSDAITGNILIEEIPKKISINSTSLSNSTPLLPDSSVGRARDC